MESPPPHYNFAVVPRVDHRDPLWHPHVEPGLERAGEPEPGGVVPRIQPETPPEPVHMPGPSYWPLVMSLGLLVMTIGALAGLVVVFVGLGITFLGLYGWAFEPVEG